MAKDVNDNTPAGAGPVLRARIPAIAAMAAGSLKRKGESPIGNSRPVFVARAGL
jgi:hypothetical protein